MPGLKCEFQCRGSYYLLRFRGKYLGTEVVVGWVRMKMSHGGAEGMVMGRCGIVEMSENDVFHLFHAPCVHHPSSFSLLYVPLHPDLPIAEHSFPTSSNYISFADPLLH